MPDSTSYAAAPRPTFRQALLYWFRLGCISFGGPAGQIAIMQTELVDQRRWIDQRTFLQGLSFCTLLPGPEAQQLATYVGWRLHGTWGGVAAGTLFVLPGAALLLLLSWLAAAHGGTGPVAAIFNGLKPVVIAIVSYAVWRVGRRTLHTWQAAVLAAAAFVGIYFLDIDFPWIVLAAGAIGWLSGRLGMASLFDAAHQMPAAATEDHAATAQPRRGRLAILVLVFAVLWAVPVGAAILVFGTRPFLDIAQLFTQAAFVTFGGAYAVLPYVAEEAVEKYLWLTAHEMVNGLALAETTPGPLILVLQYVGFFAGWKNPGAYDPIVAALVGAGLTTYVTFLPSFLMILASAPYIAGLHENRALGAALGAVTAAVVGVILNLAVYLGGEVFFPASGPDYFSIAAACVALIALARFELALHWLVIAGCLAGLAEAYAAGML